MGYNFNLQNVNSVCWYPKIRLESGPVTENLPPTVMYSDKLLINGLKSVHSLTILFSYTFWCWSQAYLWQQLGR